MMNSFVTAENGVFPETQEIICSNIKICNGPPSNILNLKNNRKQFKNESYRYLLNNSVYSVKEILEFSRDN